MAIRESWERISEELVRLKDPVELFVPSGGGLSREPVEARRGAAVAELGQLPNQVEATLAIPEADTMIELVFTRGGGLPEVDLRIRRSGLAISDREQAWQLIFRRDTGEEVRAAWLEPGEEVTIPRVEGGDFVLSLFNEELATTYEILIAMMAYPAPK